MKCPVCVDTDLVMSDRQGVEIDYCPKCRGIWLDRGELDKILERANRYDESHYRPSQHEPRRDDYKKHEYKRRKPWWAEIFD